MRTEGDFIKINEWMTPFAWIYGLGVRLRNLLFDVGALKSRVYDIPVISVGNITVGGSGKTPHVEYLVDLLKDKSKVAVLSRGYKRKSRGYVLADDNTAMREIGDEPYQMKKKFEGIYVAVDRKRTHGIERLMSDSYTSDVDVILLDDAFQHRYVKPGINILLVDYHRLIFYDKLLPAGRLREPIEGKSRADIVVITKCPKDLKPMDYRVLVRTMGLFPYQELYFTTIDYGSLRALFGHERKSLPEIGKKTNVMLLTGIASPQQMILDLQPYSQKINPMTFADHHQFTQRDVELINSTFANMSAPKIIITTEKDSVRLESAKGLTKEVRNNIYVLPIKIGFLLGGEKRFNKKIIDYVRKDTTDSVVAERAHDDKSSDSHHTGDGFGTISFRNNR